MARSSSKACLPMSMCFSNSGAVNYWAFTNEKCNLAFKGRRNQSTICSRICAAISSSEVDARISVARSTGMLDLSDCGLCEIPEDVFYISDLTDLSLAGNNIGILPNKINRLQKLCRLGLAGNRLTELPASIGELKQLEGLWVHGNILKSLPHEIGDLGQLRVLALAGNKLESLPNTIMRLSNLQILSVAGNYLEQVPVGIGSLRSLRVLALHGNHIRDLPNSLSHLSTLQELWLQGNHLEALTLDCSCLKMVKQLSLADNKIAYMSESVGQLQALKSFWLYGNRLAKVPCSLTKIKTLSNLWLEGNLFEPRHLEELLQNFTHLKALGIDNVMKLPRNVSHITHEGLRVSKIAGTGVAPIYGGYFKLEHSMGIDNVQTDVNMVIVAFGSAPGIPNWGGLLRRVKAEIIECGIPPAFDILYVVDSRRSWYTEDQSISTKHFEKNMEPLYQDHYSSMFQYFHCELKEALKKYKRVLMLGDSMGASAALTFSSLATSVIAFCPQVDLESSSIRPGKDHLWMKAFKEELLRSILATNSRVTVHCGSWSHDINQANMLPSSKVNVVTHGVDDHRLAKQLDIVGKLVQIVKAEILVEMELSDTTSLFTNRSLHNSL